MDGETNPERLTEEDAAAEIARLAAMRCVQRLWDDDADDDDDDDDEDDTVAGPDDDAAAADDAAAFVLS
ncbi:MAG: hypothetical protein AAFV49_07060, partial [Pseudomonadota bacterium]